MEEWIHHFERTVEEWHWWFQVRREILHLHLERLGLDRERALLLDIGSSTGTAADVMSRHGRVVALDRSHASLELSQRRPYAHRVVGTAEKLPFRDESFDAVAALDVLEHLDNDVAGAEEIRRVLKPGGAAVIFVPALRVLWGKNDDEAHHRRRYLEAELRRTVEAAGFEIESSGYFNFLLLAPMVVARIAERVVPRAIERVERQTRPSVFNEVLRRIFQLELPLLRLRGMPLGSSVFCIARR